MKKTAAIFALLAICAVNARAADLRLKDFPACPGVTSTTSIFVDRGIGVSSSERATPAQVCQAGATTTPAAGVVPKADGAGLLPAGFLPAATTSVIGGVILATPTSDTTAGHAVQASDARLPPAPNDDAVPIGNGTAYQAKVLPNCIDTGGNHLNYTAATNAFSCGTSGGAGSGTVTSVGLTLPSWLAVTGSPVTTSGTLAVTAASAQTADRVLGTCGGATSVSLCALTASQIPTVTAAKGGTGLDTSGSTGVPRVSAGTWTTNAGISHLAASTSADLRGVLSDETGTGAAVFGTSPTATDATLNQAANGDTAITSTRATDTSPTGTFLLFKNAAGGTLWNVDITGSLTAGTVPGARVSGPVASASAVSAAAGTVGAVPVSIVQAGTGLYQPATNTLGLAANGIEVLQLETVASGVNGLDITPAATGGAPIIACGGAPADATCSIKLRAKGVANVFIGSNGGDTLEFFGSSGDLSTSSQTTGTFDIPSTAASATAPVYRFVGDTTTGIGRAGASQLSMIAGAKEVIRASATSPTLTSNQITNGDTVFLSTRKTDSSPTGNFLDFKNAAATSLWTVDITGSLVAGIVPVARVTGLAASATTDTTDALNITTHVLSAARLGSGTADSTKVLRGNTAWGKYQTVYKSADESVTSSTTLQNDDHLIVSLSSGSIYRFSLHLEVEVAASGGGIKIAFGGGTVTATNFIATAEFQGLEGGGFLSSSRMLALSDTASNQIATGDAFVDVKVEGTIEASNTGTLRLTWAQNASNAGATKVLRGSTMTVEEIF